MNEMKEEIAKEVKKIEKLNGIKWNLIFSRVIWPNYHIPKKLSKTIFTYMVQQMQHVGLSTYKLYPPG